MTALEQAKAGLGQAIAEQQKAEQDQQRQTELFNKKITSQQDYANAVQANLAAKAKVAAGRAALDQAQLNLDFATINSPLTGIVGRTDLSAGDYVAAGSTGTPKKRQAPELRAAAIAPRGIGNSPWGSAGDATDFSDRIRTGLPG